LKDSYVFASFNALITLKQNWISLNWSWSQHTYWRGKLIWGWDKNSLVKSLKISRTSYSPGILGSTTLASYTEFLGPLFGLGRGTAKVILFLKSRIFDKVW